MTDLITTKQAAQLLGMKYRKFTEWLRKGYVQPSGIQAQGPGTRNYFTREDLYKGHLIDTLSRLGFSLESAANTARDMSWDKVDEHTWITVEVSLPRPPQTPLIDVGQLRLRVRPRFWKQESKPSPSFDNADLIAILNLTSIKAEVDTKLPNSEQGDAR
ncbi:MAG: helix-turn-helix domain-containing protein [Desulfarculaceae bacterium]|nr:helix-turn-helix domain-containing protein [Desulfarculaceae bacterium]MCF8071985.1 helix-turn-helix domain-containing protein [Desulfarculaceae bacterium]MCF8101502.1 helix-turn-helix domain-containing protein [Desulfarculaceae bacterium]MCF8115052.1 helix-turn-helix domain-containing protein [Desulfarculaceae bacterium]